MQQQLKNLNWMQKQLNQELAFWLFNEEVTEEQAMIELDRLYLQARQYGLNGLSLIDAESEK